VDEMLIGTCVRRGAYVTVAVQLDERERPHVVLEAERSPGGPSRRVALPRGSFAEAMWFAERWLLSRGGLLDVEAESLAGSPVDPGLARAMFDGQIRRFIHLPARWPVDA
jgi:hypothetical protein